MNLRPGLPPLPGRMQRLPVDKRGYPVPWFVAWINGEPDHRVADPHKIEAAILQKRCWVCGEPLGRNLTFVLGPMCVVNRISAEPPMHRECGEFSLKACPFLSNPDMVRREASFPEGTVSSGEMIKRNPGVMILWVTRTFHLVDDGKGGILFNVGNADEAIAYCRGRVATQEEIQQAFDSGIPELCKLLDCDEDRAKLTLAVARAKTFLKIA